MVVQLGQVAEESNPSRPAVRPGREGCSLPQTEHSVYLLVGRTEEQVPLGSAAWLQLVHQTTGLLEWLLGLTSIFLDLGEDTFSLMRMYVDLPCNTKDVRNPADSVFSGCSVPQTGVHCVRD